MPPPDKPPEELEELGSCSRQAMNGMGEIAWVPRTDTQRKTIGFVRARQLKVRERYVLDDDEQPT